MNPEQTRQHLLNNSGSKYAYRFGTSTRFKVSKLQLRIIPRPTHSIYQITDNKGTRACSFGFGGRSPVTRNTCTPSPTSYTLPSTIAKTSKSFGLSRQQIKFQSFLLRALRSANGPSPNTYNVPSSLHLRNISMGERLPSEIDIKLKNIVPPPNIYNLDISGCASTGKYISSRYRNTRKIHLFGRETTCFESNLSSVGPGSYTITKDYSLDESKFKKTMKSFGSADRPTPQDKSKKIVPGPGQYQTFSEFPSAQC